MPATRLYLGIDVGSTTIKAVVMENSRQNIVWKDYQRHETHQPEKLLEFLNRIEAAFPDVPIEQYRVFITGSGGKSLAPHIGARYVQEVNAVSLAAEKLFPQVGSVIELGGQDSKIIIFKEDPKTGKKKKIASMNDKCAGGTGAVLDKINAKLRIPPDQLCMQGYEGMKIHAVAGKCGVFAETDINSLQKQGIPKGELMASLFDAIVNQNLAVLTRGHTLRPYVLLLGGPNTFIKGMKEAWQHNIPIIWEERNYQLPEGMEVKDLILVPENSQYYAALGAVEFGRNEEEETGVYTGREELEAYIGHGRLKTKVGAGPGLISSQEELESFRRQYAKKPFIPESFRPGEVVEAFLGLDAGSTSTKAVLLNTDKKVLAKAYQLSKGNPIEDTMEVFYNLAQQVESQGASLEILGVTTTGYAKDILKDVLKADAAIAETVAHTESALHFYDEVDVICDVGGQDIKIMILKDGKVKDFELNTQCSAGNGYFLQSTAQDFGIPVEEYADLAFQAEMSPEFGYGCAVFLQTDIVNFQRQGWKSTEILAGLARVLPKNIWIYVAKMPNLAQLGRRFILQGGTQHNLAAVKAQVDFIQAKFKGQKEPPTIIVHKHCGESGAIGAALESIRLWEEGRKTSFIGMEAVYQIEYSSRTDESTRCGFCKNECLRTFIDLTTMGESRRFIVGNGCEKGSVEKSEEMKEIQKGMNTVLRSTPNMVEIAKAEVFRSFPVEKIADPVPGKPWTEKARRRADLIKAREKLRIGIPRIHIWYSFAPFFRAYFESLGIKAKNIVFSGYTSESLYKEGGKRGAVDPCYPTKVGISHIHNLLYVKHRKTPLDILFYPMISEIMSGLVNTQGSWICPSICTNPEVVKAAFTKEEDTFASMGINYMYPFLNLGIPKLLERQMYGAFKDILGVSKKENRKALELAYQAQEEFKARMRQKAVEALKELERNDKVGLVLIGRPYHRDPGINHGIFTEFQKLGYTVLTQDFLPQDAETLEALFGDEVREGIISHPLDISDVWKNSASENASLKVWASKFVARHPNLVGVELSNFKCGHDAPLYNVIEEIIEYSGTPYFSFKDLDENKPAGSIRLRIETIDYFLKRYQEMLFGNHSGVPLEKRESEKKELEKIRELIQS